MTPRTDADRGGVSSPADRCDGAGERAGDAGVVASPCIRLCVLDVSGICMGCYRSAAEIGQWSSATNQQKRSIVTATMHRRVAMLKPKH